MLVLLRAARNALQDPQLRHRDRVLVALAAAHLDEQIGSSWRPLTTASVELVAYYTVLERHGYKPTTDEARMLREARA